MDEIRFFAKWGRVVAGPKTRWVTLVIWIVLTAALSLVAPGVNKEENNAAPNLPAESGSVVAAAKQKQTFPQNTGTPALLVWYDKSGLTANDLHHIQAADKSLDQDPVPGQKSIPNVASLPSGALKSFESKDGTTFVLPVVFHSSTSTTTLQSSLKVMKQRVTSVVGHDPFADTSLSSSGLHARITGPAGIAVDAQGLFQNADFALLAATTLLVLILLIVLYRSPILAFVPLIAVGFAYGVISPLLGLLAKSGVITVDAQGVSIMTVLLFGAGTDYCLFLVARFRERLYETENKFQAIREAVGGAAGAIAMSGLTVVLSLFTLLFARVGSEHRFAVPFSLSIFVMAIAGVTLLPAVLAILGRTSFFPFIPRTESMWAARATKFAAKRAHRRKTGEPGRLSRAVGRVVARRPWIVVSISVVILAILATFAGQIKTTYDLIDSFPTTMPSRQGYTLLANHFSPGTLAPVDIVVDRGSPSAVKAALVQLPFVASVSKASESKVSSGVFQLQVTLKKDPYSNAAMTDIPAIRSTVTQTLAKGGIASPTHHVWITGETATQYDTQQMTSRDTRVIVPIVIAIIAVLLLLYLRSVVAMVYLVATVLLSYFAALGTGWLVLHRLMGTSAIEGAIPLYAFIFLVALGEDYNIFMVSRIWQARKQMPLVDAISEGVSRTSNVITSAGLILAGTFAVLASLPIQILVQFGIITAIGVLLDTFIVRPFIVPSITAILGRAAFWPGRLSKPTVVVEKQQG